MFFRTYMLYAFLYLAVVLAYSPSEGNKVRYSKPSLDTNPDVYFHINAYYKLFTPTPFWHFPVGDIPSECLELRTYSQMMTARRVQFADSPDVQHILCMAEDAYFDYDQLLLEWSKLNPSYRKNVQYIMGVNPRNGRLGIQGKTASVVVVDSVNPGVLIHYTLRALDGPDSKFSSAPAFVEAIQTADCWPDLMFKEEAERVLLRSGDTLGIRSNALKKAWAQLAAYNVVFNGQYGGFRDRECLKDMSNVVWYQLTNDRSILTGAFKGG